MPQDFRNHEMISGSELVDGMIEGGLLHVVSSENLRVRYPSYFDASVTVPSRGPRLSSDLQREFGTEKWGPLAEALMMMDLPNVEAADAHYFGNEESIGSFGATLLSGSSIRLNEVYVATICEILSEYVQGDRVYDVGAGYGSLSLRFLASEEMSIKSLTALELTNEGRECLRILGASYGRLEVGECNFASAGITNVPVEPSSIILTSMANMYVDCDQNRVLNDISKWRPKYVLHFEPILYADSSHFGFERNQYLELNRYNTSLMSTLQSLELLGKVEIIDMREALVGVNALLPVSFICWRPTAISH